MKILLDTGIAIIGSGGTKLARNSGRRVVELAGEAIDVFM